MKIQSLVIALAVLLLSTTFTKGQTAGETNPPPEQMAAKYTAAIEGRTADILKILALSDTSKAVRVHDIIIAQYRALNAWHEVNDVKIKAARTDKEASAKIRASLKSLHEAFLSQLGDNLTPEQIEQVKDKMTYGKVQFTLAGYCAAYSNLSGTNKQEILRLLKEAREEALDGGSAKEKTAVFQRYKGKINNYLSQQNIHPDKSKLPVQ